MSVAPPAHALFLLAITWLLAQLEIQIEGPAGWAQGLPTWRFGPPWWLRLTNGKPLTGYHLYMTALLVVFFHLPLADGWSREGQARALSLYLLATAAWDFQWFAWNPAWGLARFVSQPIWWFPWRLGPLPVEYYAAVAASAAATALIWPQGLWQWMQTACWVIGGTALSGACGSWRLSRVRG